MSERHLRDMGLAVDQARTAASFLEAYGNTAERELRNARGPMLPEDADAWDLRLPQGAYPYSVAADAGSAFREAAQWWLYTDPIRARAALSRAGRLFHSIGQPFGLYLLVVADDADGEVLDDSLRPAVLALGARPSPDDQSAFWEPALQYPQQQTYVLLAGCARIDALDDVNRQVVETLESSQNRDGATPIGSLGTPIWRLWDVAQHLHRRGADAPRSIARHLAAMCRQYEETMTLATANSYLWQNGAAPVDVGDIDIAGIAAITARIFGSEVLEAAVREFIEPYRDDLVRDDSQGRLALAPFEAGLEFAQAIAS